MDSVLQDGMRPMECARQVYSVMMITVTSVLMPHTVLHVPHPTPIKMESVALNVILLIVQHVPPQQHVHHVYPT